MLDRKGRAHMMTFLAVPEFGSQASKVSLDAKAPVPVAQTARLASIPLLAELPAPAVEGLAAALTPAEVPPSTVLIRQGEPGDAYYAIAARQLDVLRKRAFPRRRGDGEAKTGSDGQPGSLVVLAEARRPLP
jgi:hypothetical protein